jgi:TadE-like protein
MMCRRQDRQDERGFSAVEVVLVLPVLFMFTFLIVHIGLMFHGVNVASDMADEALTLAKRDGASFSFARTEAESLGKSEGGVFGGRVLIESIDGGRRIRVTVTGSSSAVAPGMPTAIRRVVESDVERFIPERDRN